MSDRALPAPEAVPAAAAVIPLGPGFRFHPSDGELIGYYLKRKVENKPMRFDVIGEVDVFKMEPSDLAVHSKLKTKDQEWFFFCALEQKFSKGTHTNRATKKGYWNKTGEDREIRSGCKLIGVIKTLVFHKGRGPNGQRTNWVIHEYHLVENDQALKIDAYVLCRVFCKEQAGPHSGHICAPFEEQEWEDDNDGDGGAIAPGPSVVHANRINDIQQENHSQNKKLIEIDDDPKTADNGEPLTRECLPLCGLNKEAPRPLIKYKRRPRVDSLGSCNSSRQTTQDHCSSPAKSGDTISSVAATLEEKEPETVATVVPISSSTELINDMQKEKQQMVVQRETYKLKIMEAKLMINFLQGHIDTLRAENEELKKETGNKGECS